MLHLWNYSLHISELPVGDLRRHNPLWLKWTSIFISLSLFLLFRLKILAKRLSPSALVPPGFKRSWWMVTISFLVVVALRVQTLTGRVDCYLWKAGEKRNCENLSNYQSKRNLYNKDLWLKRYDYPLFFKNLVISSGMRYAYKFKCYQLVSITSFFPITLLEIASNLKLSVNLHGFTSCDMAPLKPPGMEKDRGKAPLVEAAILPKNVSNYNNFTEETSLPTLKPPAGSSSSKTKTRKGDRSIPKPDLTDMFNKLAATRENGKKKKEFTLVGFLVGEPKEFPRIFAKIRMEWKPLKGSLAFNVLKSGWFEISFSNQEDFNLIWANRPYHLFSQLLLIKQWYPGFNTTKESISQLDLWVRLHYLPEEFANSEALETIIDGNGVGKFLRMDPSHNSERWNLFTRFCINTNVEKSIGMGVIVPDEHLNQIKFSLWFDDFSPGCGACGKIAHTFRDYPNKNASIPTLQLTLKNPSSRKPQADPLSPPPTEQAGWNLIGKGNKTINPSKISIPNNNIYLTEKGGINVIYESDDSDEGLQHLLNTEEMTLGDPNLIAVAGNSNMEKDSNLQFTKDLSLPEICGKTNSSKYFNTKIYILMPCFSHLKQLSSSVPTENNNNKERGGILDASKLQGNLAIHANLLKTIPEIGEPSLKALESISQKYEVVPTMLSDAVKNENTQPLSLEEEMQEYDEEPYDYEYDDMLVDELGEHNDPNSVEKGQPIMISDDPPFSEKDLDEFINNDHMTTNEEMVLSEGTCHSLQNSINSSSSFVNGMERLIVHLPDQSKSTSSKRKANEGTEDTATSEARKGKKFKV